jgi:hypothetical protein
MAIFEAAGAWFGAPETEFPAGLNPEGDSEADASARTLPSEGSLENGDLL